MKGAYDTPQKNTCKQRPPGAPCEVTAADEAAVLDAELVECMPLIAPTTLEVWTAVRGADGFTHWQRVDCIAADERAAVMAQILEPDERVVLDAGDSE